MKKKNKVTREAKQKRGYGWRRWRKWIKHKLGVGRMASQGAL